MSWQRLNQTLCGWYEWMKGAMLFFLFVCVPLLGDRVTLAAMASAGMQCLSMYLLASGITANMFWPQGPNGEFLHDLVFDKPALM